MFTGIVEKVGEIVAAEKHGRDRRFFIGADRAFLDGVKLGDSIACSGVCLTALSLGATRFAADVSVETLEATTAGSWGVGTALNLEKALNFGQPLGGHLVSGHVDGLGELVSMEPDARSHRLRFALPRSLSKYVARKGSICVDGVSLTVNDITDKKGDGAEFGVNIIPHTLQETTLGRLIPGDPVNLEVDLLARYLEKLVKT